MFGFILYGEYAGNVYVTEQPPVEPGDSEKVTLTLTFISTSMLGEELYPDRTPVIQYNELQFLKY